MKILSKASKRLKVENFDWNYNWTRIELFAIMWTDLDSFGEKDGHLESRTQADRFLFVMTFAKLI